MNMRCATMLAAAIAAFALLPCSAPGRDIFDLDLDKVGPFALHAGYLTQDDGVKLGAGIETPLGGAINGFDHVYSLTGLAVGASGGWVLDGVPVLCSAWWIVPVDSTYSQASYEMAAANDGWTWNSETSWWWADVMAAYPVSRRVSWILGFRYDRFMTLFNKPDSPVSGTVRHSVLDEAELDSHGYIPLMGIHYTYSHLRARMSSSVVGFPYLLGKVKFHETIGAAGQSVDLDAWYHGGYFLEASVDYKTTILAGFDLGVFGRWNITNGKFLSDVVLTGGGGDIETGEGAITRSSFTLGATMDIEFDLPSLSFL